MLCPGAFSQKAESFKRGDSSGNRPVQQLRIQMLTTVDACFIMAKVSASHLLSVYWELCQCIVMPEMFACQAQKA